MNSGDVKVSVYAALSKYQDELFARVASRADRETITSIMVSTLGGGEFDAREIADFTMRGRRVQVTLRDDFVGEIEMTCRDVLGWTEH